MRRSRKRRSLCFGVGGPGSFGSPGGGELVLRKRWCRGVGALSPGRVVRAATCHATTRFRLGWCCALFGFAMTARRLGFRVVLFLFAPAHLDAFATAAVAGAAVVLRGGGAEESRPRKKRPDHDEGDPTREPAFESGAHVLMHKLADRCCERAGEVKAAWYFRQARLEVRGEVTSFMSAECRRNVGSSPVSWQSVVKSCLAPRTARVAP